MLFRSENLSKLFMIDSPQISIIVLILSSWGPSKNIKTSGFNPKRSYKNLGSSYAFALTGRSSVIKKPKGYSIAKVKKITEKYESDACDGKAAVSRKTPNVIVVMNESFTDLSYLGSFKTSADYIPFVRGLKKNTIKEMIEIGRASCRERV